MTRIDQIEIEKKKFLLIRNNYKDVAFRISHLYFVILDLGLIEPTY